MKIYFEDGELINNNQLSIIPDYRIDAKYGYTNCDEQLEDIMTFKPDAVIYTNHIGAFSNIYAWNEKLKVPEIYIRAGEHMVFTRIDELTDRELRFAHNLSKMYIAGSFEHILVTTDI